jgi:hypothetical protein
MKIVRQIYAKFCRIHSMLWELKHADERTNVMSSSLVYLTQFVKITHEEDNCIILQTISDKIHINRLNIF